MPGIVTRRLALAVVVAGLGALAPAAPALAQSGAYLDETVTRLAEQTATTVDEVGQVPAQLLSPLRTVIPAPTPGAAPAEPALSPQSPATRSSRQPATVARGSAPSAPASRGVGRASGLSASAPASGPRRRMRIRSPEAGAVTPARPRRRRVPAVEPAAPRRVTLRTFVALVPTWVKVALALVSAALVMALLAVLRSRRQLGEALHRAHHDLVTGLPNRAAVDETLARMTAQAARSDTWLSVVMLDIDHFKSINDLHGHQKGDDVLAELGALMRASVRGTDFVGRFGGEELIVILPDTDLVGAHHLAEKLGLALREASLGALSRPVTASLGAAAGHGDERAMSGLVAAADAALYRAKAGGRDRVEIAEATPSVLVTV